MASVSNLLHQAALAELSDRKARVSIVHAQPEPLLEQLRSASAHLRLVQDYRELVLALESAGFEVSRHLEGRFDLILIHPAKNRTQTLGWVAAASRHLGSDGRMLLAAANREGARGLASRLQAAFPMMQSQSRSKCRLFHIRPGMGCASGVLAEWQDAARMRRLEETGLYSMPGLFSWDRIDTGSAMLMRHLPGKLRGTGMDLCCGNGVLARHIMQQNGAIAGLHLVDHDRRALDCARRNLAGFDGLLAWHWLDATSEVLPGGMDWIVCNPPFHQQQKQDAGIGQRILENGCRALKPGGELWIVANRKLPYEQVLNVCLSRVDIVSQQQGYKIIRGVR